MTNNDYEKESVLRGLAEYDNRIAEIESALHCICELRREFINRHDLNKCSRLSDHRFSCVTGECEKCGEHYRSVLYKGESLQVGRHLCESAGSELPNQFEELKP